MTAAHVRVLSIVLSAALIGCGGNDTSSARDVARIYVDAVSARDWEAACQVSVHGGMDDCVNGLREVYGDPGTDVPTMQRTQQAVEEIGGRKVVHFEYVLIK